MASVDFLNQPVADASQALYAARLRAANGETSVCSVFYVGDVHEGTCKLFDLVTGTSSST